MPRLRKRSISLSGHATSLALEPEFWETLTAMAAGRKISLASLIVEIDSGRADRPLASACRVAALAWAKTGR
ncbi:MAG: ribbon-helix-helix domain-containing protein [Caulobacteraceae bacterium]|nr:ribbon-helix-helix domain-containing protein [Caulobacteraceae bacterium]